MKTRRFSSASGFTLLEALVALLVLSLGVLGVAAMQLQALQSAHMGYQRSLASLIAIDAQERAWAELAETGGCPDSEEIEGDWVGHWFGAGRLLRDEGSAFEGDGDDCTYDVNVIWEEERLGDDETLGTFDYVFRLPELDE